MRIDFTSYGHLLNESNQAKSHVDWYFLMQHHLVPTRLLDWSTNALGALYFAVEEYSKRLAAASPEASLTPERESGGHNYVAVWVVDAYWLADRLSDDWSAPLLAYTEDAAKYVPPLDRLVERFKDARALVPKYPMPIEPPAMHPRVAAQEGRFIIFGRAKEMLHQKIRLERGDDCEEEDCSAEADPICNFGSRRGSEGTRPAGCVQAYAVPRLGWPCGVRSLETHSSEPAPRVNRGTLSDSRLRAGRTRLRLKVA